jgi:teichuronic acid biosynthesis glycosyltransferase TuaG
MSYISILLPLYNGIEFLNESLESIFLQTYINYEIIIGINGHYNDIDFFNNVNNIVNSLKLKYKNNNYDIVIFDFDFKSKSKTLNSMVKKTKYDYIALIDVDDKWVNNKLELQIKYLENYDIIGTSCSYFGDIENYVPTIPYGDITNHNFLDYNPIINSSVLLKKNCAFWTEDDNIQLEDYDLWLRLKFENKKFYNIDKILCYHRIHRKSFFNNTNSNNISILKNKWHNLFNLI